MALNSPPNTTHHPPVAHAESEEDALVQWGDIVYFEHETQSGYLYADGCIDDRVGLMKHEPNQTAPDDMSHCLFMVCPTLRYIAKKQFDKMKQLHSTVNAEYEAMQHLVTMEEERNRNQVKALVEGTSDTKQFSVDYGAEIQLLHISSHSFVTGARESATCQKDGLKLTLDSAGNKLSQYKVMPRYSFRAEGAPITYGDKVSLESVKMLGHSVSASTLPYEPVELEPLERNGMVNEVNMHASKTGWKLKFYERTIPEDKKCLSIGDYICMYHSEADGFLYASNEPQQSKVHCIAPMLQDEMNARKLRARRSPNGSTAPVPEHPVFLRRTAHGNPEDPYSFTGKNMWQLERKVRNRGGVAEWKDPFRLRHVQSMKYLMVEKSIPQAVIADTHGGEKTQFEFKTSLVDDMDIEEVDKNDLLFYLRPVNDHKDVNSTGFIPKARVSIRLEHVFSGSGLAIPGEDRRITSCYLHNTGIKKKEDAQSVMGRASLRLCFTEKKQEEDALSIWPLGYSEEVKTRKIVETIRSMSCVADAYLETLRRWYGQISQIDLLIWYGQIDVEGKSNRRMLEPIPDAPRDAVCGERISPIPKDPRFGVLKRADTAPLIGSSMQQLSQRRPSPPWEEEDLPRQDGEVTDVTGEMAKNMISMLESLIFLLLAVPAKKDADPLTVEGPPNKFMQNLAREMKLMDRIFLVLQVPEYFTATLGSLFGVGFNDGSDSTGMKNERVGESARRVQKLGFKVLTMLFNENRHNEQYFATQEIALPVVSKPGTKNFHDSRKDRFTDSAVNLWPENMSFEGLNWIAATIRQVSDYSIVCIVTIVTIVCTLFGRLLYTIHSYTIHSYTIHSYTILTIHYSAGCQAFRRSCMSHEPPER
jgi:hypothetical protein